MARVKQITPIDIESMEPSSPTEQREEGDVPVVEIDTTLVVVKRLCILSVGNHAMSTTVLIEIPSEVASSSSNTLIMVWVLLF